MSKKAKIICLIVGGVVLMLALLALMIYLIFNMVWKQVDKYQIDEQARTFLEAIVEADNDKLHSVSYDKKLDVQSLIDALEEHEIVLEGEIALKRAFYVNINIVNGAVSASLRYNAKVGEDAYTVSVEYAKDANGEGIRQFYVKPK